MQAAIFPPMLWAQRSDLILLTVSVQDATDVSIQLVHEGKALHFSCSTPDGKTYAANLDFFKAVLPEESHHVVRPRQIELKLKKAVATGESADGESWPRLTLDRTKNNNIQVDWSKWQDSDAEVEDEELGNFGLGGDEGGEGGDGGYSDLLNKFMQQQGRAEAAQHAGVGMDEVPAFGAAQGQTALTEEELRAGERRELDDDDDMPPLEEM